MQVPRQVNSDDCGVHVLCNMATILGDMTLLHKVRCTTQWVCHDERMAKLVVMYAALLADVHLGAIGVNHLSHSVVLIVLNMLQIVKDSRVGLSYPLADVAAKRVEIKLLINKLGDLFDREKGRLGEYSFSACFRV